MKNPVTSIGIAAFLILAGLHASAEQQTSTNPGKAAMQGSGNGGMGNMSDAQLRAKQDDLMARINATQDPAKRERLKKKLQKLKAHQANMMQHGNQNGTKMNSPSGQRPQ